jgi:hypothetical protein
MKFLDQLSKVFASAGAKFTSSLLQTLLGTKHFQSEPFNLIQTLITLVLHDQKIQFRKEKSEISSYPAKGEEERKL